MMKQTDSRLTFTALIAAVSVFAVSEAGANTNPLAQTPDPLRSEIGRVGQLDFSDMDPDKDQILYPPSETSPNAGKKVPERMGVPDEEKLPRKKGPEHADGEKMCCAGPGCGLEDGREEKPGPQEFQKQCTIENMKVEDVDPGRNDWFTGPTIGSAGRDGRIKMKIYGAQVAEVK